MAEWVCFFITTIRKILSAFETSDNERPGCKWKWTHLWQMTMFTKTKPKFYFIFLTYFWKRSFGPYKSHWYIYLVNNDRHSLLLMILFNFFCHFSIQVSSFSLLSQLIFFSLPSSLFLSFSLLLSSYLFLLIFFLFLHNLYLFLMPWKMRFNILFLNKFFVYLVSKIPIFFWGATMKNYYFAVKNEGTYYYSVILSLA